MTSVHYTRSVPGTSPPSVPAPSPGLQRRWPVVLIGAAVAVVMIAAVVFVVTRGDDPSPTAGATTTTSLRPCVQAPRTTTSAAPAADPVDPADPAVPPDGTYLASITPNTGTSDFTLTILVPGQTPYPSVRLADGVAPPTGPTGGAITVADGTVRRIDTGRVTWDDELGRGDTPCTPATGCESSDAVPHAWPGGVDGELGDTIQDVPARLGAALAKWGVEVDPFAITLDPEPCVVGVGIGSVALRLRLALVDDGYVLAGASTDDPSAAAPVVSAQGEDVSIALPADLGAQYPGATVEASVRYGDRSAKGTAPSTASSVEVTIARRATQRGAVVLKVVDADGTLVRLVAFQVPAS